MKPGDTVRLVDAVDWPGAFRLPPAGAIGEVIEAYESAEHLCDVKFRDGQVFESIRRDRFEVLGPLSALAAQASTTTVVKENEP